MNLVAGTLGGGSGQRGWAPDTDRMTFVPEVSLVHALTSGGSDASEDGTGRGTPLVVQGGSQQDQFVSANGIAPTLAHSSNTHGGHHQPWVVADTLRSHPRPGSNSLGSVAPMLGGGNYGQGNLDEGVPMMVPAYPLATRGRADGAEMEMGEEGTYNALRAGDGGSSRANHLLTGMAVRRLTPVECERLQGFPDGWTAGLSDSARYRMLGNAVCVPVAEWIGRRIVNAA